MLGRDVWNHGEFEPQALGFRKGLVQLAATFHKDAFIDVDTNRSKFRLVYHRRDDRKSSVSGLDLFVADVLDSTEDTERILSNGIADGIQLNAQVVGAETFAGQ